MLEKQHECAVRTVLHRTSRMPLRRLRLAPSASTVSETTTFWMYLFPVVHSPLPVYRLRSLSVEFVAGAGVRRRSEKSRDRAGAVTKCRRYVCGVVGDGCEQVRHDRLADVRRRLLCERVKSLDHDVSCRRPSRVLFNRRGNTPCVEYVPHV